MKEKIQIENWRCDKSKVENHHYSSDGTYLFGFSCDLLSKSLYKKVLAMVREEIELKNEKTGRKKN